MIRAGERRGLLAGAPALLAAAALCAVGGCGGSAEYEAEAETVAVPQETGTTDLSLATAAEPPMAILRGHWKLDETGGATVADSAGTNNGTAMNMSGTEWSPGRLGGALSFDGTGYVRVPHDHSLSVDKEITVAAWIYLTDAMGNQDAVQKGNNYALWEIREGGTPHNAMDLGGDDEWELSKYTKGASWFLDAWHHVAYTYDGSRVVNYIDGEQDGEPHPQTGDLTTNFDWLGIGANGSWADAMFKGKIDDVRVYAKALTSEEIKAIYQEAGL